MSKKVVVECKPDEKLARALGFAVKHIAHQPNKGEVCNYLRKENIQLAIIDEDPNSSQPKFLNEFHLIEERHQIRKLHNNQLSKTIYVLQPRLEEWILGRCAATGINIQDFHLPANNKRLKDEINYRLVHFENLLQELVNRNDVGMLYLKANMQLVQQT